jgi:hypothetical protein
MPRRPALGPAGGRKVRRGRLVSDVLAPATSTAAEVELARPLRHLVIGRRALGRDARARVWRLMIGRDPERNWQALEPLLTIRP